MPNAVRGSSSGRRSRHWGSAPRTHPSPRAPTVVEKTLRTQGGMLSRPFRSRFAAPDIAGRESMAHPRRPDCAAAAHCDRLMNPQRLFGDEDLELLELPQQGLFELSDEASA